MSAKKEVDKMIAKRQRSNSRYKARAAKNDGVTKIVKDFIKNMEKVVFDSTTAIEFGCGLEKEAATLDSRLSSLDDRVQLVVMWNKENIAEDWKDLQVEGVKIIWSSAYLKNNPKEQKEKHITLVSLFMSGELF